MFRLIGMVVFFVVAVIGFPSMMRWYSGDATPKETVEEIRGKLSDTLANDKNEASEESSAGSTPNSSGKPEKYNESFEATQPEKETGNLQKMINEVNKK